MVYKGSLETSPIDHLSSQFSNVSDNLCATNV